jgi:hypothetical protein
VARRLAGAAISLAVGVAIAWLADAASAQPTGTERFCSPDKANVVFFIDVTTPYDEIDKKALIEGIGTVFESLEGGSRIAIRTIADTFANSATVLDECVPYCESGGFLEDFFSSNCTEGVVINEKKHLRERLVAALSDRMERSSELKYSEIIRTLAMPGAGEFREGRKTRFFIFSDMIENSQYLSGAKFFAGKNAAIISMLAKDRLVPGLPSVEISVFGIGRTGDPNNRQALPQDKLEKLLDFWETYFSVAGTDPPRLRQTLGALD